MTLRPILRAVRRLSALAGLAVVLVWATGRLALADGVEPTDGIARIEPIAGWRAEAGMHVAGLRIRLAPGWITYWRSAGSGGIPPRFDWSGSGNVTSVHPAWPAPRLFRKGGTLSIGYTGTLVLPLHVATGPGPATLRGKLDLGVCETICVPMRLALAIDLPEGGAPVPALQAALADGPARSPLRARCALQSTRDGLALTGEAALPSLGGAEAVVFETGDPGLWVTDAAVRRQGDRIVARSEILAGDGRRAELDPAALRITVIGANGAVELAGCAP